jgi:hypothetical protein
MKGDQVGAGLGEIGNDPIDRPHHQVDIDRRGDAIAAQRLHHRRAKGEIGNVVVVHHIEMHPVGAGRKHRGHVVTETGQVGRENGRCKQKFHGSSRKNGSFYRHPVCLSWPSPAAKLYKQGSIWILCDH